MVGNGIDTIMIRTCPTEHASESEDFTHGVLSGHAAPYLITQGWKLYAEERVAADGSKSVLYSSGEVNLGCTIVYALGRVPARSNRSTQTRSSKIRH